MWSMYGGRLKSFQVYGNFLYGCQTAPLLTPLHTRDDVKRIFFFNTEGKDRRGHFLVFNLNCGWVIFSASSQKCSRGCWIQGWHNLLWVKKFRWTPEREKGLCYRTHSKNSLSSWAWAQEMHSEVAHLLLRYKQGVVVGIFFNWRGSGCVATATVRGGVPAWKGNAGPLIIKLGHKREVWGKGDTCRIYFFTV